MGQGGEKNLEQSVGKRRVSLVYIQARHNGHNSTGRIISKCQSAGVEYRIIGKFGHKAILKAEGLRKGYLEYEL